MSCPIHASSSNGAPPTVWIIIRNRRGSIGPRPRASIDGVPINDAAKPDQPPRPSAARASRTGSPAQPDSASRHGPGTSVASIVDFMSKPAVKRSPSGVSPTTVVPSGRAIERIPSSKTAVAWQSGSRRAWLSDWFASSTRKKMRSPTTPFGPSSSTSTSVIRRLLTGVCKSLATVVMAGV